MKPRSLLWRVPLFLFGFGGICFAIWAIWFTFVYPIPWKDGGILVAGYSLAVMPLCGFLIWTSTRDEI